MEGPTPRVKSSSGIRINVRPATNNGKKENKIHPFTISSPTLSEEESGEGSTIAIYERIT